MQLPQRQFFCPAVDELHVGQRQAGGDMFHEANLLGGGFYQRQAQTGPDDAQRQARQPRASSHIDHTHVPAQQGRQGYALQRRQGRQQGENAR